VLGEVVTRGVVLRGGRIGKGLGLDGRLYVIKLEKNTEQKLKEILLGFGRRK